MSDCCSGMDKYPGNKMRPGLGAFSACIGRSEGRLRRTWPVFKEHANFTVLENDSPN